MISEKMSKLLERSAAMSSMYTESARLKEKYGAENVYDFGMGNPNLPAPDSIRETSIRVLQETDPWYLHHYMPNNGFPEAREKIAASLNRRFGEHFDANNIMMCTGAAGGLNCLLKVLMDPGQEILTFAPYFGEYDRYADNVGCTLTTVPPNIPTFQPDPAVLEKCVTEKTRAVLIDNPNNPTGVVYNEETIRAIAAVLAKKEQEYGHAIYLISDEPYRELVFDGASVPWIPNDYKNTIVAYSFSKSLSLPGDRIGYLALRSEVEDFENIVAIKEAAGNVAQVAELYSVLPEEFTIYSGDDGLILPFMSVGATGLISVLSNIGGGILQDVMQAYEDGRVREAAKLNARMVPLANAMFIETNPIPVKAAVTLVTGIDAGQPRLPLTPMEPANKAKMVAVLQEYGLVK